MVLFKYNVNITKELQKIKQRIIVLTLIAIFGIGITTFVSAQEKSEIPSWIKTAVGFWVNDKISDKEFLNAIEYFVQNDLINVPAQKTDDKVLIDILQIMQEEINMKIETSRKLVNLPQIQDNLIKSNTAYAATGNPEEVIRQVEERWQSSDPDKLDSYAYNMIYNPTSDILRSIMDIDQKSKSHYKYAEIFVTNQYGGIVAQSNKTSDFNQSDEMWWQKAKQNGVYLSSGGYDESAGVYASDFAIRILDEKGSFVGVLKAVINIESINEDR